MKLKFWMIAAIIAFFTGITIWSISADRGSRIGAICEDGWRSQATGSGACSWHGGVDYWLYEKEPNVLGVITGVSLTFGTPIYATIKFLKTEIS